MYQLYINLHILQYFANFISHKNYYNYMIIFLKYTTDLIL